MHYLGYNLAPNVRLCLAYLILLILSVKMTDQVHISLVIFTFLISYTFVTKSFLHRFSSSVYNLVILSFYLFIVIYFSSMGKNPKIAAAIVTVPLFLIILDAYKSIWVRFLAFIGINVLFYLIAGANFSRSLLLMMPFIFIKPKITATRIFLYYVVAVVTPIIFSLFLLNILEGSGIFYVWDFGRLYYLIEHMRVYIENFPTSVFGLKYEFYMSQISSINNLEINSPHLFLLELHLYYGILFGIIFWIVIFEVFRNNGDLIFPTLAYIYFNPITDLTIVILTFCLLLSLRRQAYISA